MPIINQVVSGGGTTPTGTIQITTNGIHDVSAYANADVQVPTTAPTLYREFSVNVGMLVASSTSTSVIDFSLFNDVNEYMLYNAYKNNTIITGVIDMSNLTNASGGYCMDGIFAGCSNVTGVLLTNLKQIKGNYALRNAFTQTGITGAVSIPKLELINGIQSTDGMFYYDRNITSVDMPNLVQVGRQYVSAASQNMFKGCSGLASATLPSLAVVMGMVAMRDFFNGTALTTLSFPALYQVSISGDTYTDKFNNMLSGVTGCTVHFPSNMQSVIGSWSDVTNGFGGTNTTVLFDLPSTEHLIGANTTEYERSPKDDTQTALAWRVKDVRTSDNLTVDWTPFYTNGTTDPAVSDTIYSDSACTTTVTTISSIA